MKHLGGVCVSISLLVSVAVAHAESWALTLFLTPNCSRNVDSVQDVLMFLRRHPEVQGSGVLLVELHELDTALPQVRELVSRGCSLSLIQRPLSVWVSPRPRRALSAR